MGDVFGAVHPQLERHIAGSTKADKVPHSSHHSTKSRHHGWQATKRTMKRLNITTLLVKRQLPGALSHEAKVTQYKFLNG
jgi:hypothetical protein